MVCCRYDITVMKDCCFYMLPWHCCCIFCFCCFETPFSFFSFATYRALSQKLREREWGMKWKTCIEAEREKEINALPACLVCEHTISLYWEIYVPKQCLLYHNKWWAWLHLQRMRERVWGGDGVRVRKRESERKLWAVKKKGRAEEKRKQMHLII